MGSASEGHGVREVPRTPPSQSHPPLFKSTIRPSPVRLPSCLSPYLSITLCHHSPTLHIGSGMRSDLPDCDSIEIHTTTPTTPKQFRSLWSIVTSRREVRESHVT